jgi:hypothetical protein
LDLNGIVLAVSSQKKPGNGRLVRGVICKMRNLPFWLPRKKNFIWYLLFIGFFLLSLDFWMWNNSKPLILGLPFWIWYLLIITLLLSVVYYLFVHFYWRDDE